MYKVENWQLKQRQGLPYEAKISFSMGRIRNFYDYYGGGVYLSFSGGKDSTVLYDLVKQIIPKIKLVYCNTGLEYPEINQFVNTFDNLVEIKPSINFKEVINKYGYPLVSKEVSKNIYYGRKAQVRGDEHMVDYYVHGKRFNKRTGKEYTFMGIPQKWMQLYDSDIPISNKCCDIMKKDPFRKFEKETGLKPFVGVMASDSQERTTSYMKTGCNSFDDSKRPMSRPLSIWYEQDILRYIYENKIKIASVYGDVVKDDNDIYKTTGVNRTGCMWCAFGLHLQETPNKMQQMKETHPQIYDYCLRECSLGGLGYKKIFDFLSIKYE